MNPLSDLMCRQVLLCVPAGGEHDASYFAPERMVLGRNSLRLDLRRRCDRYDELPERACAVPLALLFRKIGELAAH